MKTYSPEPITKRIFAGLLAVWMSDVVFLLCCAMPKAQAAEIESCPLAKKGHCDKSATDKSAEAENAIRFETSQSGCPAFNCCGFLPQVFDKVKKAGRNHQFAKTSNKISAEPPPLVFIK